jgi:serine/threonine protein kinase
MDKLLVCNPRQRITASQALDHDYFWTDPLPADPKTCVVSIPPACLSFNNFVASLLMKLPMNWIGVDVGTRHLLFHKPLNLHMGVETAGNIETILHLQWVSHYTLDEDHCPLWPPLREFFFLPFRAILMHTPDGCRPG